MGVASLAVIAIACGGENFINRIIYGKPVFIDVSAEAMRKTENKMRGYGIKCTVLTVKSRPTMLQGNDSKAYYNVAMAYNDKAEHNSYVYYIYVPRIEIKGALQLLSERE